MTEWNAPEYARIAGLQEAMATEVLSLLDLKGTERVLDLGCGNGKVTAEIAARVPQGVVVGMDASAEMVSFATSHFGPAVWPNLRFEVGDVRQLPFRGEFDLVVSFNALHSDTRARRGPALDTLGDEARWFGTTAPGTRW